VPVHLPDREQVLKRLVSNSEDQGHTMDTTTCPGCGAPAEVVDRTALESTDGPMEHVKIQCVRRHWFLMPTAMLADLTRMTRPTAPAGNAYTGHAGSAWRESS
jgi:hypothetical protein